MAGRRPRRLKRPPPAAARLKAWLAAQGQTQADLAAALNVGPSTVWAWMGGASRPDPTLAAALDELTAGEVPARAWADPEDVARVVDSAQSLFYKKTAEGS
jgi:transcriptional regulator with XRE-family HTH domain